MQIQPITEEAFNAALFTITASRSELLHYRMQVQELQRELAGREKENAELIAARERIKRLEEDLIEAKSRITIHKLEDTEE